jgi:membrane-associated PAP2 superfamily phosphatase
MARPSATSALRRDAAWLAVALCVLLAWDASGLDLALARRFGGADGFVWRDHWLTARFLHDGGRVAGWLALAVAMVRRDLPARRRLWWLGTSLSCALAVTLLKHASATSCPWSLSEFGGVAVYVSHWQWGLADGGAGGCFPSGHAASALALLPGAYALERAAARRWLAAVLVAALVFGLAQMMRGAHYASHTLWTGWVCWAVTAASHHAAQWRPAFRPVRLQRR